MGFLPLGAWLLGKNAGCRDNEHLRLPLEPYRTLACMLQHQGKLYLPAVYAM